MTNSKIIFNRINRVILFPAGQNRRYACAHRTPSYDETPFFWTMQYGNSIKFTGSSTGHDQIVFRGDVDNDTFSAGYFRGGRLIGVSTIGRGRDVVRGGAHGLSASW